jgi:hypothetical protein
MYRLDDSGLGQRYGEAWASERGPDYRTPGLSISTTFLAISIKMLPAADDSGCLRGALRQERQ